MSPLEGLTSTEAAETIISITPAAIAELRELRDAEPNGDELGLRLEVVSGPGEPFRYDLSFDEFAGAATSDEVRTVDGFRVIVPVGSVRHLAGATLDHNEAAGLVIRNPNRPDPPVVDGLISGDDLSARVEAFVTEQINPQLALHGGFVTYAGHDGDGTVYMTMGGGCHGCSMSKMTMLDGVETMLSTEFDEVQRVHDLTDHTTGANPFYS